LSLVYNTSKL